MSLKYKLTNVPVGGMFTRDFLSSNDFSCHGWPSNTLSARILCNRYSQSDSESGSTSLSYSVIP